MVSLYRAPLKAMITSTKQQKIALTAAKEEQNIMWVIEKQA